MHSAEQNATPGMITRAYAALVQKIYSDRKRATAILLLLLAPAIVLTIQYFVDIHAGMQELLPTHSDSVRALDAVHERIGGVSSLNVIAHSNDRSANRHFIDALGDRLRARKIPEAKWIQSNVREERSWAENHAALLLPKDRFESIMDSVEHGVELSKATANPFYVNLEDESPDDVWKEVEEKLDREAHGADRFPDGYLEMPDGSIAVLAIALRGSEVDVGPSSRLLDAVREEVAAIRKAEPKTPAVDYNGEVVNMVEEHDAIAADVGFSSVVVALLVGALIALYFRSWRAVVTVLLALYPGLLVTFALGRLSGSFLNSNSAFLGSIIAGNGINYPLIFLAFYRSQASTLSKPDAIVRAATQALPGTLAAATTASAAYLGLATASFRGFSQFGGLGCAGMITTWAVSFLVIPLCIAWLDPPRQEAEETHFQKRVAAYFSRRGLSIAVAVAIVASIGVVGSFGVKRALHEGTFDMNLLNLRNSESLRSGGASWDARMSKLFGVWMNPVIALVANDSDREVVATAFRKTMVDAAPNVAERVETIEKYVPPEAEQRARITRLQDLSTSIKSIPRENIPERSRPYIDRWLAEENLRVLAAADIPQSFRRPFTEVSGETNHSVLLYPQLQINYNDGANVMRFAEKLSTITVPKGTVVAGAFLFMAEIIRLIRVEAPRLVLLVCLFVAIALLPVFWRKPLRIVLVVLSVAIVAVSSQAVMFALGVRLNMLNFAALPITIGVGSDYVVNLLGAMDALKTSARRACARMGGAILLCSLTTVIGYTSLLFAHSGALRSFGWAAVLGEVMASTVVLLVIPTFSKDD